MIKTRLERTIAIVATVALVPVVFGTAAIATPTDLRSDENIVSLSELNFDLDLDSDGEVVLSFSSDGDTLNYDAREKVSTSGVYAESQLIPTAELAYGWSSSAGSVELVWDPIPGVSKYNVFREGILVGTTSVPSYRAVDEQGDTVKYSIEAELDNPVRKDLDRNSRGADVYVPTYNIVMYVVPVDYENGTSLSDAAAEVVPIISPLAASQSTQVQYTTFITDNRVGSFACNPTIPGGTFGGDNRSWSATSASFRTRSTLTIHWPSKNTTATHQIGQTRQYNPNGSLHSTKTASASGLKATGVNVTSTSASFTLEGFAANPYCNLLNQGIFYDVDFTVTKAGTYAFSGERRKAPHHESYIRADNGSWSTVLRKTNAGFGYLLWGTGHESLSGSGAY